MNPFFILSIIMSSLIFANEQINFKTLDLKSLFQEAQEDKTVTNYSYIRDIFTKASTTLLNSLKDKIKSDIICFYIESGGTLYYYGCLVTKDTIFYFKFISKEHFHNFKNHSKSEDFKDFDFTMLAEFPTSKKILEENNALRKLVEANSKSLQREIIVPDRLIDGSLIFFIYPYKKDNAYHIKTLYSKIGIRSPEKITFVSKQTTMEDFLKKQFSTFYDTIYDEIDKKTKIKD